jgi:hypothetical protein
MDYKKKFLKYKMKYERLSKQFRGGMEGYETAAETPMISLNDFIYNHKLKPAAVLPPAAPLDPLQFYL